MASDKIEYSRLLIKRSNVSGEIPTVPPVSAVTLNQFTPTDIFVGEFFANVEDETLYFRTNTGIVEIAVSGSTGTTIPSLIQVLNQGNTTGGLGIEVSSGDTITYNGLTSGITTTFLGLDASGNTITTVGGAGAENLETTLGLGNTTGANDIIFTQGYRVKGALNKGYFEPEGADESISINYTTTGNTGYLNIGDSTAYFSYTDAAASQSFVAIDGNKIQMTSNGGSFTTEQYGASSGLTINPEPGFPLYVTNLVTGTSVNSLAIDANDRVILAPAAINGTNGTSGTSGVSGTNGTSGTSGAAGDPGSSGTSGVSGSTGSSGTSGADGLSTITIGTTAISGGTVGRLDFQGTGDVVQQDSQLFWDNTNKGLGVGATPAATVKLDVRADSNLSTDLAFRVRNSVDSQNMIEARNNGRVSIGLGAGAVNTSTSSTFIGFQAGLVNTTGSDNTFVGDSSGHINSTGSDNTFIGYKSGYWHYTGNTNSAVGVESGYYNGFPDGVSGDGNIFFGYKSGKHTTGGGQNLITTTSVYLGSETKANANNETNQIVIGYDATGLGSNSVVLGNSSITKTALRGDVGINNTSPTAQLDIKADSSLSTDLAFRVRNSGNTYNIIEARNNGDVYIGLGAGAVNTSSASTFIGGAAGFSNTTGSSNTFIGSNAGYANTTGQKNTFVGNATGSLNTADNNTFVGYIAGYHNTTGSDNVFMGYRAGTYITGGLTSNTTGNTSVFIGSDTKANASNETNQIVIGYDTTGLGSNTVVLGNSSITKTLLRGDVVLIDPSDKFGYDTGAGGTVTQATNKSTGVTLNRPTGQITMNGALLAADTTVSFTLTNSVIALNDILVLQNQATGTLGAYTISGRTAAGSATISVRNVTAGGLSEAMVISFAVIKAVTA